MRSRTTKSPDRYRRYFNNALTIVGIILYATLLLAAFSIFSSKRNLQTGQLIPGQSTQPGGISRSLDLRVAAKNTYPSDKLSIVRDLGTINGLTEKIISFKVPADGLTEFGLMFMPATAPPPGGFPAIILCHGYDNPSLYVTTRDHIGDMEFYASHGFAVIKPDYRGQGLSIHQGLPNSAYYSMSYNTDVMSLITALKKTSFINKNQLNLWGHSMGAYIALRAAVLSPDIKNLILLSGPVDSLSKMYVTYIPPSDFNNLQALKTRNEDFAKYGIPVENSGFWKYASPINLVGRIKAHVQIHVGQLDQVVPPEFSADLDQALTAQHIKHEYYVYPDGQHSLQLQRPLIYARSLQDLTSQSQPAKI